MAYTLTEQHIRRLCRINFFPVPLNDMIFFGIRGCLPVNTGDQTFKQQHDIEFVSTDRVHLRCTLGQWLPQEETIALFPASTVPHHRFIVENQMITGYYNDYRRGIHSPAGGQNFWHKAFKMAEGRPVQRPGGDEVYDNEDVVEHGHHMDNIHAAKCLLNDANADHNASAGCQVVAGYHQAINGSSSERGPWKIFRNNAYNREQQTRFAYALWTGFDVKRVIESDGEPVSARLRYGSEGELVRSLQQSLTSAGYYHQNIDPKFGRWTFDAVKAFQTMKFGPTADDGIVGEKTAGELNLEWPKL